MVSHTKPVAEHCFSVSIPMSLVACVVCIQLVPEAFLTAAVWGGQWDGHICVCGITIPDDIIHVQVSGII